ncbi:biopolymer transporter ExbD [Bartonella rattaustraliani]|uniref:biopolymer transporter ExbD n=1 Tax=Bartonella rattaustraliani TaxID=481139 RepID=UPI0002E89EEB|nr:biopolymer transporter ExbD [Bartonella rattaustraliani]
MKASFDDDWETDDGGLHNEINVTPFIDVVLVLLIVFMVAAPLATSVIPVQLPSMTQAPAVAQPDKPLYVTLQKDRSLYVGDHLVNQTAFMDAVLKATNQNLETKILIKADTEIDYGTVVDLLSQIRTAGYTKVGLMGLQKSSHVGAKNTTGDAKLSKANTVVGNISGNAEGNTDR